MIDKILNFKSNNRQDILQFQNEIINSKSARNIFLFAKYVNGADVNLLSKELIKQNDERYLHFFIRTIKNIDYDYILNEILNKNNPRLLFYVAYDTKELNEKNLLKIANKLYDLNNAEYLQKFMYYYFCVEKGLNNEIFLLLKKYLNENNITDCKITINNIKSILENLKSQVFKGYIDNHEKFSKNCYLDRNGMIPDLIVCHITSDYKKAIEMFYNKDSGVSSHFIIDANGKSKQIVDLKNSSWANGTSASEQSDVYYKFSESKIISSRPENANFYSFSIEHISYDGALTEAQYEETIKIMSKIIRFVKEEYNYDFIIDREHILGHSQVNPIVRTSCPGRKFPFDKIIADLQEKMK